MSLFCSFKKFSSCAILVLIDLQFHCRIFSLFLLRNWAEVVLFDAIATEKRNRKDKQVDVNLSLLSIKGLILVGGFL